MAAKPKLKKHEKEILNSYEEGEWKSVQNLDSKIKEYSNYAKNTLRKDKRINIRINEKDLESIQNIAIDEGIPYQTLISSLIHKFVSGKLIDKSRVS
ncbi:MAG: antitoxin [Leptospirales bacterium]